MADYGDNDIGVLGGAFKGFAQGMMDAEDRAYKKMEMTAKLTAQREDKERQRAEDEAKRQEQEYKKKKDLLDYSEKHDVAEGVTDISEVSPNAPYSQRYLKMIEAQAAARASADPYGNKSRPTEGEYTAAGFAERMDLAERDLEGLLAKGFDPSSGKVAVQEAAPRSGIIGKAAESLKSSDVKQYQQAKDNFISAVLRKESGAAIGKEERAAEEKKYFPQVNDTPEVVEQKRLARAQAAANFRAQGERALPRIRGQNPGGLVTRGLIKPAPVDPATAQKLKRLEELRAKAGK